MEKNWELFWKTGKVTDYLDYCKNGLSKQEKGNGNESSSSDRDGADIHAHQ